MEKLLELLNQYEEKKGGMNPLKIWKFDGELHYYDNYKDCNVFDNVGLYAVSKGYGFIKWLVNNDKIDTGGKITEDLTYEYFQIPRKYFRGGKYARLSEEMNDIFYHRILACLSIQDNPIEWLCEILK